MTKILSVILTTCTLIAIGWANYRAYQDTKPFFIRMKNKIFGFKIVSVPVDAVKNVGGRVVHMFDRKVGDKV